VGTFQEAERAGVDAPEDDVLPGGRSWKPLAAMLWTFSASKCCGDNFGGVSKVESLRYGIKSTLTTMLAGGLALVLITPSIIGNDWPDTVTSRSDVGTRLRRG
jgi:hypothetical protein